MPGSKFWSWSPVATRACPQQPRTVCSQWHSRGWLSRWRGRELASRGRRQGSVSVRSCRGRQAQRGSLGQRFEESTEEDHELDG